LAAGDPIGNSMRLLATFSNRSDIVCGHQMRLNYSRSIHVPLFTMKPNEKPANIEFDLFFDKWLERLIKRIGGQLGYRIG